MSDKSRGRSASGPGTLTCAQSVLHSLGRGSGWVSLSLAVTLIKLALQAATGQRLDQMGRDPGRPE